MKKYLLKEFQKHFSDLGFQRDKSDFKMWRLFKGTNLILSVQLGGSLVDLLVFVPPINEDGAGIVLPKVTDENIDDLKNLFTFYKETANSKDIKKCGISPPLLVCLTNLVSQIFKVKD